MKKKPSKKKVSAKKAQKVRKQFVKPRLKAVAPTTPKVLRFIYVEARRFDDGLLTFDHIEVLGARNEPEAYQFGAAQLDTRQQANDPAGNGHLLALVANDYAFEVK